MVELVWDAKKRGTGRTEAGMSLTVGTRPQLSAEDLLGLATASCVMTTFLTVAEGAMLRPLSYLSTTEVETDSADRTFRRITVSAFVTAAEGTDRLELEAIFREATRRSPMARLLGDRVSATLDTHILCDAAHG
jgi:organic hydroperoxide reductase OsmC/OhrA